MHPSVEIPGLSVFEIRHQQPEPGVLRVISCRSQGRSALRRARTCSISLNHTQFTRRAAPRRNPAAPTRTHHGYAPTRFLQFSCRICSDGESLLVQLGQRFLTNASVFLRLASEADRRTTRSPYIAGRNFALVNRRGYGSDHNIDDLNEQVRRDEDDAFAVPPPRARQRPSPTLIGMLMPTTITSPAAADAPSAIDPAGKLANAFHVAVCHRRPGAGAPEATPADCRRQGRAPARPHQVDHRHVVQCSRSITFWTCPRGRPSTSVCVDIAGRPQRQALT